MPNTILLRRLAGYDDPALTATVAELLAGAGLAAPMPGAMVLVKPNLVAPRAMALSCTRPEVVRAVCKHLLTLEARVVVADSPAFGTGRVVARLSGLAEALSGLPVRLANLDRPQAVPLSFGGSIGVAGLALSADHIVSVPRLKCHDQMAMSGAVKNLFGCVCGFRKSLGHQRFGNTDNRFARMILEVGAALPSVTTLMDGVIAMHRHGPTGGDPYPLGLLGAATNPVALDTAVYALLGLSPDRVPLWREAKAMGLAGTRPGELAFPLEAPDAFDATKFSVPDQLAPVAFSAKRFLTGRLKSLLTRLRRR
jgi:uncharacterized protein (DUF362 family)